MFSFSDWLLDNTPGSRTIYFSGHLAQMKHFSSAVNAATAWRMAAAGVADLVQKKNSEGGYDYIAIRRRKVDKTPVIAIATEADA